MKGNAFNLVVVSVAICVSLATLSCSKDEELHAGAESLELENARLAEKVASLEASIKAKEGLLGEQATKIQALEQANIELKSEVEVFRSHFQRGEKISQPDSISSVLEKIDANVLTGLGAPFDEKSQALYLGKLRVKAYTRGFICANEKGETEVVILKEKNPHLPSFGLIGKVFKKQGGSATFGNPIEGQHTVFNGEYHLHVFEKAVIFWSRIKGTQSAIFSSKFR